MAKLKRKNCRNTTHDKREIFPRKAKDQTLVNLEQLSFDVIMEVIETSSGSEYENKNTDYKKRGRNKPTKKSKKQINICKTENKQIVVQDNNSRCRSSERNGNVNNTNRSLNKESYKSRSPVLLSTTGGLTHFMELGARTDLCDSSMADPLGPASFDTFQWVEVKQELPDDIEVCHVTLTELPLKIDDDKATNFKTDNVREVNDGISDHKGTNNDEVPTLELAPTVPCNKPEKSVETNTGASEDKEGEISEVYLGRDGNSDGNSSADEIFTERPENENIEEIPSRKKRKYYPQQCDICDKKLYSKGNLRLHKLRMHKMKVQFGCELCSVKFDYQREAVQHRNSAHRGEDGRFGCGTCGRRLLDYHSYLAHVRTHCGKGFRDEESLVELRGRLKSQEKNFICDSCGRRFAFSCLLRDHLNTHSGAKPYICQKCGKAFCQKSTLKQHTKTHSEVRPFQCDECPQGFYSKGDYIKHRRKHTGERPYVCEVCGEGFSRNTHLVIHRRTHTGERPHVCDICDRGFTKRGDVVRHRRVHTGELPYLCQVCGKAFRQSTQCANHIKSQHPDSPASVARNPKPLVHGVHMQLLS